MVNATSFYSVLGRGVDHFIYCFPNRKICLLGSEDHHIILDLILTGKHSHRSSRGCCLSFPNGRLTSVTLFFS